MLVERRGRRLEWFVASPSDEVLAGACAAVAPTDDVWLTVLAEHPVPAVPGTRLLAEDESLMGRTLTASPPDARVGLEVDGDRACATVWVDGVAASRGWVGISGTDAVFDRIETDEAFRRRGLGSVVMTALESWAVEQGATDGLLAATVAGQALYARLGWSDLARLTSLAGVSGASS